MSAVMAKVGQSRWAGHRPTLEAGLEGHRQLDNSICREAKCLCTKKVGGWLLRLITEEAKLSVMNEVLEFEKKGGVGRQGLVTYGKWTT